MLVVLYCNEKECKRIHIRTDKRNSKEHVYCPRCGNRMKFVCDFLSWVECDLFKRRELIKDCLVIRYKSGSHRRVIKHSNINNIGVYYEIKELQFKYVKLKKDNEKLKILVENYEKSYSFWKERGIVYHDELWNILSYYEPEKYNRDYITG